MYDLVRLAVPLEVEDNLLRLPGRDGATQTGQYQSAAPFRVLSTGTTSSRSFAKEKGREAG
ncbi:hypothetical protein AKJ36_03520 [candidate division MSBL1 archaeon SCGC-AAA259I07]|uniref:Uncharacterized protein n=1 Tax=candidate division MSBL1 archaeon SCGC-AAA259I07 TaxID=1698266 RepID=A0A133UIQ6_9EURY|nr:hypothetical protein AKJ36_03520 [candidate division MSBL1 archaeon SCGC-AAA259I07]